MAVVLLLTWRWSSKGRPSSRTGPGQSVAPGRSLCDLVAPVPSKQPLTAVELRSWLGRCRRQRWSAAGSRWRRDEMIDRNGKAHKRRREESDSTFRTASSCGSDSAADSSESPSHPSPSTSPLPRQGRRTHPTRSTFSDGQESTAVRTNDVRGQVEHSSCADSG